jgi:DNA-binding SARP family transcriptional activator/tetratricopeptide (TPR) repeat protein
VTLSLSLLGVFRASLRGRPVTEFYSNKVRALLAYLAVEIGQKHPRPVLAALLWPEWDDRAALGNLRFSLSKLRQSIQDQESVPPFLLIDRESIQLNPAADVSVDVHLFLEKLRASRWASVDAQGKPGPAARSALADLTATMDLVRGPFLDGFAVGDSAAFEEWMLLQREELNREVCAALHGLTDLHRRLGEHAAAEASARRLLELDPWDELANRHLMAILVEGGQRNAALRHYTAYRAQLARELGCEPEAETQILYAQIRGGTLAGPELSGRGGVSLADSETQRRGEMATPALTIPEHSGVDTISASPRLPTEGSTAPRFVAREQELARLDALLHQALRSRPAPGQPARPEGGVALIAGEAGSGKTALLDEFARRACHACTDLHCPGGTHLSLIVLRGSCSAHNGTGDAYLPFREMLQTLAGDVEGKRAGGTLSPEQARRVRETLPAVVAALVEHGPDVIDRLVPGEALLRRAEKHAAPLLATDWLDPLRELVLSHSRAAGPALPGAGPGAAAPQPDLFAQVTQVLHAISVERPLLLAIDDMQWAGADTAALLFHLGRRLAGSRILLVCAYRPEAIPDPSDPKGLSRPLGSVLQELARQWGDVLVDLDEADGRRFVEAYVDAEPNRLGTAFRQALHSHTGGNPLFTVELLRGFQRQGALVQDGAGRWVEATTPNWEQGSTAFGGRWPLRVEVVIAGHLAGLPEEDRALLQVASVQGERFVAEVAARVLGRSEEAIVQRLSGPLRTRHRLVEAISLDRLSLSERGQAVSGQRSPGSGQRVSRYRFRHMLVQASAYRSLDAVEQARLHEATAQAITALYDLPGPEPNGPADKEKGAQAHAPELAQHYEAAGLPLEAARYRLEAGQWAAQLAAYDDAIAHLQRGLTLLDGMPAARDRLHLEMAICLALVTPALLGGGWRAAAYTGAFQRLSNLAEHPGLRDDPQRLTALCLLGIVTTWSADTEGGQRVGKQLLALAHDQQDLDGLALMMAHWVLGMSHWLRGQLVAAREHLDQAVALDNPKANRAVTRMLGANPGDMARAMLSFLLWLLGYPDQSRRCLSSALARAQMLDPPSRTAFVHAAAGMLHLLLGRDVAAAQVHSQALQPDGQLATMWGPWSRVLATVAEPGTQPGDPGGARPEQALAQAADADAALQAMGSGIGEAAQLLLQAQTSAPAGQPAVGLAAMDRALAWIERTGTRDLEAEVWRTRGELLLLTDRPVRSSAGEAETHFQRALAVAREQEARWLELRAAVSLARLWQGQGRRDDARELLADIYGWFTEGFDTVDLVEAKALLAELEIA